ncbi:MAG: cytochrome P450 [Pseudomonadota bacterium]
MKAQPGLRPPGPPRLPLLGQSLAFARDPIAFLAGVARKYGDIAYFRLGSVDVYFVSHPDLVREVLLTQRASFTISPLRERLCPVVGRGLFTSHGALHAQQRRLMQPVFRKSRIESYAGQMAALAQRTRDRWADGGEIDAAEEMMQLTMFVAAEALFGHDIGRDSDAVSRNVTHLLEYFTRLVSPFFSLLLRLPLPSTLRFRRAVRDLDAVIYRMIEQRRASGASGDDLLARLMRAKDDETQAQMTETQLRDELLTLLIAGHETTANLLAWTLFLLGQDPEADARMHDEVRHVLAGRSGFAAADTERMPYTRKVILEGLRLYPSGWFIGRSALADVSLGGYTVPRGAVVMLSQYIMQRDARFYDAPERFLPERWTEQFERELPRGAFFPFSAGDRHCIGEGFAWQEAILILATLLERWKFELIPGQNIRPRPSVTLRPDRRIRMHVRRRG